jgi:hypothetical protein
LKEEKKKNGETNVFEELIRKFILQRKTDFCARRWTQYFRLRGGG